jgi:hypothetical protein
MRAVARFPASHCGEIVVTGLAGRTGGLGAA